MSKSQLVEAVMFFDEQGGIDKQMFYTEFETLLDGLVRMPALADQQVRVAYVTINGRLHIRSLVFFYLDFDETGAPDSGWNIPLQQISERAGRGPDLGSGPIRLACRSQCPVSWHQMHLWDPALGSGRNDLATLRDTVKLNSLGLVLQEEPAPTLDTERLQVAREDHWYASDATPDVAEKLAERLAEDYRHKATQLVRLQRERLVALSREQQAELARVKSLCDEQLRCQQAEIQSLRQALRHQEAINLGLKGQLAEQTRQQEEEQEQLNLRLLAADRHARTEREVLREQFADELRARIATTRASDEQQAVQREQLALQRGAERMLERLAGQGVVFVVYHPGAGHLTVSAADVEQYLSNPLTYVAGKCSVSESHYQQWLEHYQRPRCDGLQGDGQRCAAMLERVETPGRFVPGDSNCCLLHKANALQRTVG